MRDCGECGTAFEPPTWNAKYCGVVCIRAVKARRAQARRDREAEGRQAVCLQCGTTFPPTHGNQGLCSDECWQARRNATLRESFQRRLAENPEKVRRQQREGSRRYNERNPPPPQFGDCAWCGQRFEKPHGKVETCSDDCRKARKKDYNSRYWDENRDQLTEYYRAFKAEHRERYNEYSRTSMSKRRAALAEVEYEDIDRQAIYERDGWVCQLCGDPVDPSSAWPDTRSASLDHVVPVSEGGGHTVANTQLAHYGCNAGKAARALPDGEQLRIIG